MLFNTTKTFALCVGKTQAVFCRLNKNGKLEQLSFVERLQKGEIDTGTLVAGVSRDKGQVALIFPLAAFEIVNVSVPPVTREAVARVLPFNLSKILQSPVQHYIYDWQIAREFKDRFELAVYLFPIAQFNRIQQDLKARNKEICWFEPDVFSACSYLEKIAHPALERPTLVLIVWESSISIAVYENEVVTLCRSVDIKLPAGTPAEEKAYNQKLLKKRADLASQGKEQQDRVESEAELLLDQDNKPEMVDALPPLFDSKISDDILAGFDLLQQPETAAPENTSEGADHSSTTRKTDQKRNQWELYIQKLVLEVARTSDYHHAVLKGGSVAEVVMAGGGHFFKEFKRAMIENQPFAIHPFPVQRQEEDTEQILASLCIGALNR